MTIRLQRPNFIHTEMDARSGLICRGRRATVRSGLMAEVSTHTYRPVTDGTESGRSL